MSVQQEVIPINSTILSDFFIIPPKTGIYHSRKEMKSKTGRNKT